VARKLRHDDPRSGREHFDARAGREWERGLDPTDIRDSIPDAPWNEYGRTPNIVRHDFGQWAVTDFGLELFTDLEEYNEAYRIAADQLLHEFRDHPLYWWPVKVATETWVDFDVFEAAFRKALKSHFPPVRRPPKTLADAVAEYYGQQSPSYYPSLWDSDMLEETFRVAKATRARLE
jgi:hypothetical protein